MIVHSAATVVRWTRFSAPLPYDLTHSVQIAIRANDIDSCDYGWMTTRAARRSVTCCILPLKPEVMDLLGQRAASYRTADITPDRADLVLNMEEIDLSDESVDTVMANHVLEHVNDRKALSEIRRILRPGGPAILTTPVIFSWQKSYENPRFQTEEDRFRHFGQQDHIRYFDRDIEEHIQEAGLKLDIVTAGGEMSARHALIRGDAIFLASRPDT